MLKNISFLFLIPIFFLLPFSVSGQQSPVLTATLHSNTSPAQTIPAGTQNVDVAWITLSVTGGDVYINGFYVDADLPTEAGAEEGGSGGLDNINSIFVYDVSDDSLVGTYPVASENPNLIEVSPTIFIGNDKTKTYLLRASFTTSAIGDIQVGFSGFKFATETAPDLAGVPIYSNTITIPGAIPISSPTPVVTPEPEAETESPTPIVSKPTPAELGFTNLAELNLTEGDTISATDSPSTGSGQADDPDIYIANEHGYKRLFLNPAIFSFYGHLGGFPAVKNVASGTRDILVTSGLFRNCDPVKSPSAITGQEQNDSNKVYALEVTGEDTGVLHWVNTTGDQAVADDPEFFKKIFCINSNEFNWYPKGADYTSVNQVPDYSR